MAKSGKGSSQKDARIAREQSLMRKMGERKQASDAAKSLGSPPPQRSWFHCLSYMGFLGGGAAQPRTPTSRNPLWGGDDKAVEANEDDGYYRPMKN